LDFLERSLANLLPRDDLHTLIFTGVDDVFASGADIRELAVLNSSTAREFAARGQRVLNRIAKSSQRTIAAINGYCMGGALDLALACNVRIASRTAVFAHPGVGLGIITGWGGTQRLPRLIGQARALELFMTAKRISSEEALEIGLISEIYDPVLDRAVQMTN
jgi:enoyl-CoA hydratase